MSDENVIVDNSAGLVNTSSVDDDSSSSSLWMWALFFIVVGIFMLVGYYYFLHFYNANSISDAIENAIKMFNENNEAERQKDSGTGDTGGVEDDVTFKQVLIKALDNATTEGFSTYEADASVGTIQKRGSLNWGFIEDDKNCSIADSDQCMSGDIFPTRDIHINPKLRI